MQEQAPIILKLQTIETGDTSVRDQAEKDGDRLQNDEHISRYYNLLVSAQGLFSLACRYFVTAGLQLLASLTIVKSWRAQHIPEQRKNFDDIKALERCSQTWDTQSGREI